MASYWKRWALRAKKLRQQRRPLRFLASRALWQSRVSRLLTADVGDGLRIRFYPSSVSAALWVEPDARSEDVEFLRLVLRAGDSYVDCGANIGHLALVARKLVRAEGKVTAIEASPRIFSYCVGNLQLNRFEDVVAINVALGETAGTTRISDQRADDMNRVGAGPIDVALKPLDEVIAMTPVTLLKIDVEGYELFVLRGAARTLAHTKFVYCELSAQNTALFGYTPADVETLLEQAGFVFATRADTTWRLSTTGVFASLSDTQHPTTGYNVVAIHRSAIEDFATRVAAYGQRVEDGLVSAAKASHEQ